MLKGPPKNTARGLPNPPKSRLKASKIELGGLQDGIFCPHRSIIYSCQSSKPVQGAKIAQKTPQIAI